MAAERIDGKAFAERLRARVGGWASDFEAAAGRNKKRRRMAPGKPVEIPRNKHFFRIERAAFGQPAARVLIPAPCSAIS